MKTFKATFVWMGNGKEFVDIFSAQDEDHAYLKASDVEVDEAAGLITLEEI